ncbi:MAG: hypothetical protein RR627_11520, partial [Niameybacter sp.]
MKKLKVFAPFMIILVVLISITAFLIIQKPNESVTTQENVAQGTQPGKGNDESVVDSMLQQDGNLENSTQESVQHKDDGQLMETGEEGGVVQAANTWSQEAVYVVGDTVVWENQTFKAKWWTSGEQPNANNTEGAWEYVGVYTKKQGVEEAESLPTKETEHSIVEPTEKPKDFKIVGYYPEWKPDEVSKIQYDQLTHINYSFAIPQADGTVKPLDNPKLAKQIIADGHKNNVKVL